MTTVVTMKTALTLALEALLAEAPVDRRQGVRYCTHTHTHTHTCIYTHMYIHTHTCIYTNSYIYIHTQTHTHNPDVSFRFVLQFKPHSNTCLFWKCVCVCVSVRCGKSELQ